MMGVSLPAVFGCATVMALTILIVPGAAQSYFETIWRTHECTDGKFFDVFSWYCLPLPSGCPEGAERDTEQGCRCPEGQSYNGLHIRCENICGDGEQQYDEVIGSCRYKCNYPLGYDILSGTCKPNRESSCERGNFYDKISQLCLPQPTHCPIGSLPDPFIGCYCENRAVYDGQLGQCSTTCYASFYYEKNTGICKLKIESSCEMGTFYDMVNRLCLPLPTRCPVGSVLDTQLGCLCKPGKAEIYNGQLGQCEFGNYVTSKTCSSGQRFIAQISSCVSTD